METTRDIYFDACSRIGANLVAHGFKYAKSGSHAKRAHGDFIFGIYFQSSVHNTLESKVALWIHAIIRSKRLSLWRTARTQHLRTDDWVAGGHIGNLRTPQCWLDLNLADAACRPAIISSAISVIADVALPFFAAFEDVPKLCERLATDEIPGMDAPLALEFLLCFGNVTLAEASFHRFLHSNPEILRQYHVELERFQSQGLPAKPSTAYAVQLAFATIAYGLKPPGRS